MIVSVGNAIVDEMVSLSVLSPNRQGMPEMLVQLDDHVIMVFLGFLPPFALLMCSLLDKRFRVVSTFDCVFFCVEQSVTSQRPKKNLHLSPSFF